MINCPGFKGESTVEQAIDESLLTSNTLLGELRDVRADLAWSKFVDLYQPLLLNWTQQMGLAPHESTEVLSDVYCKLVEHLPVFIYDPQRSFRSWLWRLQHNAVMDQKRKRARKPLYYSSDLVANLSEPAGEESEFSTALALKIEDAQRLARKVQDRVAHSTWMAFVRTAIDGVTPREVALELGISLSSVYVARNRVQKALREEAAEMQIPELLNDSTLEKGR